MIFPGMDPNEKRRREEEARRRALLAEQGMQEYRERSDRLLASRFPNFIGNARPRCWPLRAFHRNPAYRV